MLRALQRELLRLPSHFRRGTPRLIVQPAEGLANRLRAVASCQALANVLSLRLSMVWEPSFSFSDDRFNDLFANPIHEISEEEMNEELEGGTPKHDDWFQRTPGRKPTPRPGFDARHAISTIRRRGFVYRRGHDNLIKILRVNGVRGTKPLGLEYRRCLQSFTPAAPLAAQIDEFARRSFDSGPVIGVHIRRGDAMAGPYAEQYRPSTDEAFRCALDEAVKADADLRFFLATDCEETERRFRGAYPDRIITRPKTFVESEYGIPKQGQLDATIELTLLSRTRRIIGTRWSSFGRVAAMMGGIPFDEAVQN